LSLLSPNDGQTYTSGSAVILNAIALDYEDGEVPDSAYLWSSDKDGELGSGASMWGLPLNAGEHTITVSVADRDGNSTSESAHITILEDLPEGRRLSPTSDQPGTIAWGALLIVGAVIVGIGAWVFFSRRKAGS
jgi:hypothetical protein